MLKSLIFIVTATCSFSAFAQDDISAHKAEMTANMDKRISMLNEAKTCIASASTKEDMKKCHQGLKEDRMEMRKDHLGKKEARLQDRLKKVQEQKAAAE
jgi:hypothetical protein